MSGNPTLEIYKASAGSGKTFLLTEKYLKLLFEKTGNFRHILAVTFTNKATAEMKHRILHELKTIAQGNSNSKHAATLQTDLGVDGITLKQQASKIYSDILHNYGKFSITTIDSFVQNIVRSFAFELGFDSGFKIELNQDVIKEALTERLIALLDTDSFLRDWVLTFAKSKLQEGKNWDFTKDIQSLSGEMFKENFQRFEAFVQSKYESLNDLFLTMRNELQLRKTAFEQQYRILTNRGLAIINQAELSIEDFSYGKSGFINIFNYNIDKVSKKDIGKRVLDVLENPEQMIKKTASKDVKSKASIVRQELLTALRELVDFIVENAHEYNTATLILSNFDALRLMEVFTSELGKYRSENNVMLISDTHALLNALSGESANNSNFIYEKVGNYYHHFLIDEFQDTGNFQWQNFLPLLRNALSEGFYNLIVGDVKQSIYRWRNGDWRLLEYGVQRDLKPFRPAVKALTENWRSAVPVIEFNNFLYDAGARLLQNEIIKLIDAATDEAQEQLIENNFQTSIIDAYQTSFQYIPDRNKNNQNGSFMLKFVEETQEVITEENNEEDVESDILHYDEVVLNELNTTIVEYLEQGFAAKDIAILTRNNRQAKAIINALMTAQETNAIRYNTISSEALIVQNNNAVKVLVFALQYLVFRYHLYFIELKRSYIILHNITISDSQTFFETADSDSVLPKEFLERLDRFQQFTLLDIVNEIIQLLGLNLKETDVPYLLAFQDVVLSWVKYGDEGVKPFLDYWDKEQGRVSLPAMDNADAVEVLTVHKSKGLAFRIVLMPYIEWGLKPTAFLNNTIWVNTEATPFNKVPYLPIRYSSKMERSAFSYEYIEETLMSIMDNFNLLYVATTRAEQIFKGWVKVKKSKSRFRDSDIDSISKMLLHLANNETKIPLSENVVDMAAHYDPETMIWQYGTAEYVHEEKDIATNVLSFPTLIQSSWHEKVKLKYTDFNTHYGDNADIDLPRQNGIVLHEIMSRIQQPDKLEVLVEELIGFGTITNVQALYALEVLTPILKLNVFNGWWKNEYIKLSEQEIVTDAKAIKRPDFILYNDYETLIIDFKFTETKAAIAHHSFQVEEYMKLLMEMGFANVKGYIIYGLINSVHEVKLI